MGIKEDLAESNAQYISIFDTVRMVASCEGCGEDMAFKWLVDKNVFDGQMILGREENSTKINPLREYFYNKESGRIDYAYENEEAFDSKLAAKAYSLWLKINMLSRGSSQPSKEVIETGFARKRLYDTLTVNGVYIPPSEWQRAKSFLPDDEGLLSVDDYLSLHGANTLECLEKRDECTKERAELKRQNELLIIENKHLANKVEGFTRGAEARLETQTNYNLDKAGIPLETYKQNKPLTTKEEDNLVSILHILCSMQRIDLSNQTQTFTALETHARANRLTVPSKNTVIKFLKMTGYSPIEDF